jgi:predicted alpha-1,2-mannosidase
MIGKKEEAQIFMRVPIALCLLFFAGISTSFSQHAPAPVDEVNLLVGTAGDGQTFPAVGSPFAMTQWTPQTRDGEEKCIAPFYSADTRIQGFRGSHFMSGSCTQDYGSVTLMPGSGRLRLEAKERASQFNAQTQVLTPYRYAVTLTDYGIDASMTGTARAGLLRFQFHRPDQAWVLVQSNSRKGEGSVRIDAQSGEISGFNPVHRLYAGAGNSAGFSGYFVVRFDRKFRVGGTWTGPQQNKSQTEQGGSQASPGAYVFFDLKPGETVQAKVGTSFTSIAEARHNLDAEIPGWGFEQVAAATRSTWNDALGRIQVHGKQTESRIFYTALYHSLLLPRVFSDVSGTYPGFASEGKTETARDFTYYCDFSLWDTFRAVHPLLTLMAPDRERDMVKSLIAKGEQGGYLPIYPAWDSYTSEMIGDHAVAVIADAYVKGIRGFDIEQAYTLMRRNATEVPADWKLYADGRGRRALPSYLKYGYIPLEDHVPDAFHHDEQVSRTLEYAYDDFIVGEVATALGKTADAKLFHSRGQNYLNVIDPVTGFARGRHADGSWDSPFDPTVQYKYITEGLPYQYTFFVPQDVPGLIKRVGGDKTFIAKLDALFAGGYYNHGNEPSHHIAYLYNYAGAAWKTQQHVHSIMQGQYSDRPDGLAGNDDCGQMSAWYVMSALGFYSVAPGTPDYQIGTPQFDDASILLPGGARFHIQAPGAGEGKFYIRSVRLNGVSLTRTWIRHSEIVAGGELEFEMSSEPNPHWPTR